MVPNTLFFFAPNNRTWHGASIDPSQLDGLANRDARRTFLGFITTSQWQWRAPLQQEGHGGSRLRGLATFEVLYQLGSYQRRYLPTLIFTGYCGTSKSEPGGGACRGRRRQARP